MERLISALITIEMKWNHEIIVVEETNSPKPIKGVRYIPHPITNRGIPYARNLGLSHANGNIIIFLDDDCLPGINWPEKLIEPFDDEDVIGAQGGVGIPPESNLIGWAESILGFPGGGIRRTNAAPKKVRQENEISTLNCAYRKWVVNQIGGFDKRLVLGGEDYQFAKRACDYGKCLFIPDAEVLHAPRGSFAGNFRWFFRRGRAEVSLSKTGWRSKEFYRYWIQSSLLAKCVISVYFTVLAGIPVVGCLTALLLYYVFILIKNHPIVVNVGAPPSVTIILPLVKIVMDIGIDCGRIFESIREIEITFSSQKNGLQDGP